MVRTFRDLIVWQKAVQLVTVLYQATKAFPKEELYGLVSQMRRCAVSIPSNIAEGYGRNSTADYLRFLQVAVGSVYELQTQLEISKNLAYVHPADYDGLDDSSREIERMLTSLIKRVRST